jgi:hypothetical protein
LNLQRNSKIEAASLDQELLLYDSSVNKFYVMNATAAFLWQALTTTCDEQVLADLLCEHFEGVSADGALVDVRESLEYMVDLQLIFWES